MDKDKSFNKKKAYKIATISLISIVLLGLLAILIAFILLNDNHKNTHIDSKEENTEIIKKNFVNGFSNTSLDGVFSFKLSNDDINQMLMNAYRSIGDTSIESIYYEQVDAFHYFYVDLPRTCMVPSRVVIETYIDHIDGYTFDLVVSKVTKGKINIFDKAYNKGYMKDGYVNKILEASKLPIRYDETKEVFKVNVLDTMEYFPKGDIKEAIIGYINLNKAKYITLGSALFDFNINFSSLRSSSYLKSESILDNVDIKSRLMDSISSFDASSIAVNDEIEVATLSNKEYSNYLSSEIDSSLKEVYTSSLTSREATFEFEYVHALFNNDSIAYKVNISISGYEIDLSMSASKLGSYPNYRYNLSLNTKTCFGDTEIDNELSIAKLGKAYMYKLFKSLGSKYDFYTYSSESNVFGFDFSVVASSISRFDVIATYIVISNNHLGFNLRRVL